MKIKLKKKISGTPVHETRVPFKELEFFHELEFHVKYSSSWNSSSLKKFKWNWNSSSRIFFFSKSTFAITRYSKN